MEKEHILIVEDEQKVAATLKKGLEEHSFSVAVAFDGLIGKKLAMNNSFDVIILDINLPLINGFDLCREIKAQKKQVPILMLTAMGTTDDKLFGFDSGADDYLVKPFEFRELLARLRVLLKWSKQKPHFSPVISIADLEIDSDAKTVKRAGRLIDLTAKEFFLLEYLGRNKGKVVSRNEIAQNVWDINYDTGTNVIDVYINFLRRKIDKNFSPKLIHTQVGLGYVLREGGDE